MDALLAAHERLLALEQVDEFERFMDASLAEGQTRAFMRRGGGR